MSNRSPNSSWLLPCVASLLAFASACQRRERGYEKPAPVNPAVAGSAQRSTAEGARPAPAITTAPPIAAPPTPRIGAPVPVSPATSAATAQAAANAWPRPPRGKLISLIYGGNREGEIEPCG